ncbi:uncharacterized protein EI90DRAFT_3072411, partial [Cantharellus anzutake]|uniref:uncharacterized protein n=1 Tax=Cantharellus anzutake TaxID=1750568 RepID=UPI00190873E1
VANLLIDDEGWWFLIQGPVGVPQALPHLSPSFITGVHIEHLFDIHFRMHLRVWEPGWSDGMFKAVDKLVILCNMGRNGSGGSFALLNT